MIVRFLVPAALFVGAVLQGADGDLQFASLGDFRLTSGEVIRDCKLGYRRAGKLNESKSNVILWPTWFGGRTADLMQYAGPDKLINLDRFHVVFVDALGNGVSSSPSNSQQKPFPKFSIRDMVNSQHQLLTREFGIQHLHAVVGISMGGMQTFEWITAYPDFMDRAVPIIGSPKLAAPDLLLWGSQLGVIELAETSGADLRTAMRVVMGIHQFALQTPDYRATMTPAAEFPKYKESFEAGAGERVTAADWASQLRAMMSTNAGPPRSVKAKVLVVVATQDHMVNPTPAIQFAEAIYAPTVRLEGSCGHLATGCETGKFTAAVRGFLSQ